MIYTIKKSADFKKIYARGKSVGGRLLVLYRMVGKEGVQRFGFSISKKTGKAVVRNRIKRVLKEICRNNCDWFSQGYDYIIIPRKNSGKENFYSFKEDLYKITRRIKNRK